MAQRVRLRVSTVTETKMFAKKMHRLVKKIQDKPVDSLEQLSEMARKRGENLSFPIEVETETQWTNLLKREGLIVVDVYSGWSGPCTSMFSILRKLKLDTNDDRMVLAAANADGINQLSAFRNQSEPCWLFLGGGKPVKVLRGSNAPNLVRTIKSEFQHELECIEGKAKRTLISIKFEASRRENAVNEAIALGELMALEEEEQKAREIESAKSPTPTSGDEEEDRNAEKEKSPDLFSERYETVEDEDAKEGTPDKDEEISEIDEALIERRKLMEESNVRLKIALRQYTVIAIQSYLIETGAVTEIKDHLAEDFNLIRERYINLNDDDARKIFGIPAQIPDPNPPSREDLLHSETDDTRSEAIDGSLIAEENPENPPQTTSESQDQAKEEPGESGEVEVGEDGEKILKVEREKTPIRMIDVPVPEVIIGDTLILLLECTRVKPLEKKESIEEDKGEGDGPQEEEDPYTADYYIIERTGSKDYQTAIDTQPKSLHAMYGKDAYVAGVWCPRTYEGKRFVMLNYFPQFVTEMLIPPVPEPPKYHIYVFSALFSSEILEHPEFMKGRKYIVAEKRTRISQSIAEKMLLSSKREGDFLRALKWALTGTEVLVVSANGKNADLLQILDCFDPIFSTADYLEAGYFTAKLFPDVEVLIDENPFPQQDPVASSLANLVQKFTNGQQHENGEQTTTSSSEECVNDIKNGSASVICDADVPTDPDQDQHNIGSD